MNSSTDYFSTIIWESESLNDYFTFLEVELYRLTYSAVGQAEILKLKVFQVDFKQIPTLDPINSG
jgi:hypothetical protein